MMLRYINEKEAAERLQKAVTRVLAEGKAVTYDLKPDRDDPTAVGTAEMANAIIAHLKKSA
jgi:isocitrate dehydrogenase (NAD+)